MSMLIAHNTGANDRLLQGETDLISISTLDPGLAFNEASPVVIGGVSCVPVDYNRTATGPTAIRLDALVHDTGFTTPERIIVLPVPDGTTFNDILVSQVAGIALNVGDTGNPFASDICAIYDADDCGGTGHWVDRDGGGTVGFPTDVVLYHELSHCFHFATGVATSEPTAEADENDMRDVRGLDHRDVNSHNGGCGGGPVDCCIVASLTTGSPYSEEIKRFRRLRDNKLRRGMAGADFFEELHYRYYAFSPEVTRLLGSHPSLRPLIRDWFVLPLLSGIELLIAFSENRGQGLARHLRRQSQRPGMQYLHDKDFLEELDVYLGIVRDLDKGGYGEILDQKSKQFPGLHELVRHVSLERANDEYIDWAFVAVVTLWVESALLFHGGLTEAEIDSAVYEKIALWVGRMPISEAWADFSRLETELELQGLQDYMLDPRSKKAFSVRLAARHPMHAQTIMRWAEREGN